MLGPVGRRANHPGPASARRHLGNLSEDRIHYHKANPISDSSSDCSYPVKVVEIQLRINAVLHSQNGKGEYPCQTATLSLISMTGFSMSSVVAGYTCCNRNQHSGECEPATHSSSRVFLCTFFLSRISRITFWICWMTLWDMDDLAL